jgi:hypothetical protein
MSTLGDRVRAAAETAADEITPDSIPDWQDFAIRVGSGWERGTGTSRRHARSRWFAPVAAAAAVIAVIAAIAVSGVLAGGHQARKPATKPTPSKTASPKPSPSVSPPPAFSGPLPRYYAVIADGPGCSTKCLVIHDARTGAVLATEQAPGNADYVQITAAADDTTFVIGAFNTNSGYNYVFLLARFDAARHTVTVRQLPIPAMTVAPDGFALSPDGTELAVALQSSPSGSGSGELRLYTLATGAAKVWTTTGVIDWLSNNQGLSWGPSGVLAFDWSRPQHDAAEADQQGIRILNTASPAGDLLTASTLAVRQAQSGGYTLQGRFALVDNGSEVVSVVQRQGSAIVSQYEVFLASTGRVVRAFLPSANRDESIWWANSDGTVLAGDLPSSGNSALEWINGTGTRHAPISGLPGGPLVIAF